MRVMISGFIRVHDKKFSWGMRIVKTRKPILGEKEEKPLEKPAVEQLDLLKEIEYIDKKL